MRVGVTSNRTKFEEKERERDEDEVVGTDKQTNNITIPTNNISILLQKFISLY